MISIWVLLLLLPPWVYMSKAGGTVATIGIDDNAYSSVPFTLPADYRPILDEYKTVSIERHLNVSSLLLNSTTASNSTEYQVPRNLWIAFRRRPNSTEDIDSDFLEMLRKALLAGWKVYLMGHDEQVQFMNDYFIDTPLSWAVSLIAEHALTAVSDVFRIAALVAFGGVVRYLHLQLAYTYKYQYQYIDDDAILFWLKDGFDELISHNKSSLIGLENGQHLSDDCYNRKYRLSKSKMMKTYNISDLKVVYSGSRFTQWFLISKQGHSIFKRQLANIVDLIQHEYMRDSGLFPQGVRWNDIICATGPDMLTSTIVETSLHNLRNNRSMHDLDGAEIIPNMVARFAAIFKVREYKHYAERKEHHYYRKFTSRNQSFLRRYVAFHFSYYDGHPVSHGHNSIYLANGSNLHQFLNPDSMKKMNFYHNDVLSIRNDTEWDYYSISNTLPACADCKRQR